MKLVEEYGTPLKFTYLPQISNNINKAKGGLEKRWKKIMMVNITIVIVPKVLILNLL
jgi:hypothetical protein